MTAIIRLEYLPPNNGTPVEFSPEAPDGYILTAVSGLLNTRARPALVRGVGQVGATLVDASVDSRTVSCTVAVVSDADTESDAVQATWEARRALARALAMPPAREGEAITPGVLRAHRLGLDTLELEVIPQDSPTDAIRAGNYVVMDMEFFAPYPYWRELEDSSVVIREEGGFEFPLEHPFEIESSNTDAFVTNNGDVDAPLFIRVEGELDTPRIINWTTGEAIEVAGLVDAGEYLEIDTTFGSKTVTHVDAVGVRTNRMGSVNLSYADFFSLRPGVNLVGFSASANVSGSIRLYWRERYAGI